ncbi:hypothetical protein QE152_g4072 [Popillia japonica]|uniref:Uncharacterized protein n=1 Tax=Popillia japonica TaxID=7064 RepID=A0AAW1MWK3_POPJA
MLLALWEAADVVPRSPRCRSINKLVPKTLKQRYDFELQSSKRVPNVPGTHCYFIGDGNTKKQLRFFCSYARHHAGRTTMLLFLFYAAFKTVQGDASPGPPTSKYDVKFLQMEPNDSKLCLCIWRRPLSERTNGDEKTTRNLNKVE